MRGRICVGLALQNILRTHGEFTFSPFSPCIRRNIQLEMANDFNLTRNLGMYPANQSSIPFAALTGLCGLRRGAVGQVYCIF